MKSILLTLFIIPFILGTRCKEDSNTLSFTDNAPIVLELFTSQGCSSCPPADKLLNEVKSDNIIALSYHVDYWNYIGWKDPFSKEIYSNKQRKYGSKFNSSSIYTPQLVINGREHIVGSNKSLLKQKLENYSTKKSASKISISDSSKSADSVAFNYNFEGNLSDKILRIVLVIDERVTSVKRGENRNKELINANIVVNEQQFNLEEKTGKGAIIIPEIVDSNDELSLILIIENKDLDILTATQASL